MDKLFSEGETFLFYPLKVVHTEISFQEPFLAKVGFAVSKKLFKRAVRRNLIKRRMREAYRLNKHLLTPDELSTKKAIFFIYVSKEVLSFKTIEKAMKKSLSSLAESINSVP
ncbi:ribonuclease P protein component [Mariniphaga anaerophila]|uniref:Ribonuclease P protein component n=2 Tax=Mariniphaga anaerophila TaxID=1484053 RepID=A0A1M5CXT5_9BACT|nr:ribonuclease P protein component [Mariniphaga anaerophila]